MLRSKTMPNGTTEHVNVSEEEIALVAPSTVHRSVHTNRFHDERRSEKMAAAFDDKRARTAGYVICEEEDGRRIWLDGQHRGAAAVMAGHGDDRVPMTVLRGLTDAEKAEWVLLFSEGRQRTQIPDQHRLGVRAGRSADLILDRACVKHGLVADGYGRDGHLGAVGAARTIAERDGALILDETFGVLIAAYGNTTDALAAPLLSGVALFWRTYADYEIDRPALIRKLAKFKGGALGLIAAARMQSETDGGPQYRAVARIMSKQYNVGRRVAQLPPL